MNGVMVVKIGGGAGVDMAACAQSIAAVRDRHVIVVHGVSAALDRLCAERGVVPRTLTSPTGHASRYTDPVMRDLFVEAAGVVNAALCTLLAGHGVRVHGMSGECTPIRAVRKDAVRAVVDGRVRIVRDDYTGAIAGVDADPVRAALDNGCIPVIAPLARSTDGLLNIDGDRAAAAVAAALRADSLIILSNVRGLYRSFPDETSFVPHVRAGEIDRALEWAGGRMKRKVLGASEALAGGVARAVIADGRAPGAISRALAGEGTVFTP
jgi:acetylglutamate/LysW-gamma-L-alpha-aminoadipate kinase